MRLILFTLSALLGVTSVSAATVDDLIARAGNAPSDAARLLVLRELSAHPELPEARRAEAVRFTEEVARYADTREGRMYYFDPPILKSEPYDFGVAPDSPLYPLTHLYRARMFVWVTMEYGGYWKDPDVRRARLD